MGEFCLKDFQETEILETDDQIDIYIIDKHTDEDFGGSRGLRELAEVGCDKLHEVHPLVYKILTLTLIVLVTITRIGEISIMNCVKNRLRNRMRDLWNDVFDNTGDEIFIQIKVYA